MATHFWNSISVSFIRFHREAWWIDQYGGPQGSGRGAIRNCSSGHAAIELLAFVEKTGAQVPGIVNGGVYVFNRGILEHISEGPASLEKDIFPRLLEKGVYALEQHGMFIDIGTPEDYARAQSLSRRVCIRQLCPSSNLRLFLQKRLCFLDQSSFFGS